GGEDENNGFDILTEGTDFISPDRELEGQQQVNTVLSALKKLPTRQQQCFMLRSWEGLSVADTAIAMGCSQGSVKTHYSRAKEALRKAVEVEQ
ncbi:MAG: sigma-70 family RNA polymerase sigma factor, partial [Kangiellaceae bacterium]|nr:sigma-70 family RNA polymerase sigma factor [Kangiellaceae bacterium]